MNKNYCSPLSVLRRSGGNLVFPIELCQRMDGRIGVFSRAAVSSSVVCRRSKNMKRSFPFPVLSLPLQSAVISRARCSSSSFAMASPHVWSNVAALVSTTSSSAPWYFEVTGDVDQTVDEQQQQLGRASAALRERKWVESAAALFVASCLVRARAGAALTDVERLVAWTYCEENHQMVAPLTPHAASMEEVHSRFRVFQMRSLLESCLLDAVTTAPPRSVVALFGEEAPTQSLTVIADDITRAVEIATSGAVFDVDDAGPQQQRRRVGHSFFAPFISSVSSATERHEVPNCRVVVRENQMVLELTRPVRAGEELLTL